MVMSLGDCCFNGILINPPDFFTRGVFMAKLDIVVFKGLISSLIAETVGYEYF